MVDDERPHSPPRTARRLCKDASKVHPYFLPLLVHDFTLCLCFTDAQSPLHLLRASTGGGGVEVGLDVSDVEDVVHPCI